MEQTIPEPEPTEGEKQAILLRFHAQHPDAPKDAKPTAKQAQILLQEIRQNEANIERNALNALRRATDNEWTYSGSRSRYVQWFSLYILFPLIVAGVVVGAIDMLINRH